LFEKAGKFFVLADVEIPRIKLARRFKLAGVAEGNRG